MADALPSGYGHPFQPELINTGVRFLTFGVVTRNSASADPLSESLGLPSNGPPLRNPSLAGVLGLPTIDDCEFGACGNGFQQVSGGPVTSSVKSYLDDFGQLLLFPASLRSTKLRLFGTHYCGPGGAGDTNGALDVACYEHDTCYDEHRLSILSNFNPLLYPSKGADLQTCNQNLCNAASRIGSAAGEYVKNYFTFTGDYYCHP